jgi:hypothetical protein
VERGDIYATRGQRQAEPCHRSTRACPSSIARGERWSAVAAAR